MKPALRFPEARIRQIAARYSYGLHDRDLIALRSNVRRTGFLEKAELKKVAVWEAPRSAGHVEKNDPKFVQEVTRFALGSASERARVEALTLLDGVSWPTASVILHFYHRDRYPILDFRALWSAGFDEPVRYDFEFWWAFVSFSREIATRNQISMRVLDKALWQYSKEKQKGA